MRCIWIVILLAACTFLTGQSHDNNWILGGTCVEVSDVLSLANLTFTKLHNIPQRNRSTIYRMGDTNTSMSDEAGCLQFYTNGNEIYNYRNEPIKNGQQLEQDSECSAERVTQGVFSVPHALHQYQYILFTIGTEFLFEGSDFVGENLRVYYNVVDMNANEGEGELIVRQDLMVQDTLNAGQGMVCQHANGRDWWILLFERDSNRYYRFLIDIEGYHEMGQATTEMKVLSGRSQVAYSPDGSRYASMNNKTVALGAFIDIHDFDRCTGILSNQTQINLMNVGFSAGLAFSPNSRFLYVCGAQTLYQYDLWAEDIEASRFTIGHWDGFLEDNFWSSTFHTMLLGPDNKIYMGTPTDGHFIHIIHDPNKKGLACDFEQRGLEWPTYKHISIPNFPHYRMGALEGSGCDTLGIDNGPLSNFSYAVPEQNPLDFTFEDLTLREPTSWSWDLGDGTETTAQHPSHSYGAFGSFQVSLVTSNAVGVDTFKRNVCAYPSARIASYASAIDTVLSCTTEEITLSASMAGEPLADYPHFRSRWMLGPDSVIAVGQDEITVNIAGAYRLDILDTIYGCRIVDTIHIISSIASAPLFTLEQSRDSIDCGGAFDLYIDAETDCFEAVVYRDDVTILFSMADTISIQGAGVYELELLDCESGCGSVQSFAVENKMITAGFSFEGQETSFTFVSIQDTNATHEWDFGDGSNSTMQNPAHVYEEAGVYEVSHIVSNACDSDTLIQTVQVISTSTSSLAEAGLRVYPNPTTGLLYIESKEKRIRSVQLYSSLGQRVLVAEKREASKLILSTEDLSAGVYVLDMELSDGVHLQEKIMVLE